MSSLIKRKTFSTEDTEVNMVPIMNMFLVLVPFLLMSASFLHIKAINTSAPVLSSSSEPQTLPGEKVIKGTVIAQFQKEGIQLSLNADTLSAEEKVKWDTLLNATRAGQYPFNQLSEYLQRLKAAYPASDTLILIPEKETLYETIIQTMDVARHSEEEIKLFPNVVLSGKVT